MAVDRPIIIATRGSALALAQAHHVLGLCRAGLPQERFDIRIIKTTGDHLQSASMANPAASLPKGLFTKELEVALLQGEADLAVHSLKDLPTELPDGLVLGAVGRRADVRDVLIYRDAARHARGGAPGTGLAALPAGAVCATSSTRRKAQLLALRPDVVVVEIRGNVATRLHKLAERAEMDATLLAAAGLERLHFEITATGHLRGEGVPEGLCATRLSLEEMLPAPGQGALGIEVRAGDARLAAVLALLNDPVTQACVTAERAVLSAMGGGCQAPLAACGEIIEGRLRLRAVSFLTGTARSAECSGAVSEAEAMGRALAVELK